MSNNTKVFLLNRMLDGIVALLVVLQMGIQIYLFNWLIGLQSNYDSITVLYTITTIGVVLGFVVSTILVVYLSVLVLNYYKGL